MPLTQSREITAASRLENVRYAIRDLACVADEVVKQGHKILPLNIGDPLNFDFQTPAHLIEAVYKAMRDGKNGYAPSSGIKSALDAIRGEAARKGITNIQDVFVTSGVSESVDVCLTALLNPGEDVLTPSPDYPLYSAVLAKLDIGLNTYYLNEEDGWQPDLDDIKRKITSRTRGIVLINPNNPTGSVCTRKMLEDIAELARRHNLVIFADEIYDKLIMDDDQHISLAAVAPDVPVVTFGGLSKNYLAPGWRIGWGIISGNAAVVKPYVEGVNKLLRARLCANHPEQYAIQPALEGPQDHLIEVTKQAALPPRSHREMVQLDSACQLRFAARSLLCLSKARHSRRRRRLRERIADAETRAGGPRLGLRTKARHQALPHRVPAGRKDAHQRLRRNRRVHAREIRQKPLTAKHAKIAKPFCFLRALCVFAVKLFSATFAIKNSP